MAEKKNTILAIESSCDDSSVSILSGSKILSLCTKSQMAHADFGGVVPELASRTHMEDLSILVQNAMEKAEVSREGLDAIAVTQGPGLLGSLHVGVSFAKGMSAALGLPLIPVHHMHAHILAHHIEDPMPEFPYLCLTVSGGHTQIVKVDAYDKLEVLGATLDDAAGEAFDKCGRMLGLDYPAGPMIDKMSRGQEVAFEFPVSKVPELNFSFSGLKTAVLRFLQKEKKKNPKFVEENLPVLCASIQSAIIKALLEKLRMAVESSGLTQLAIAGGVAANSGLRKAVKTLAEEKNLQVFIPQLQYCTDNAAMIAVAAEFKFRDGISASDDIAADARLPF